MVNMHSTNSGAVPGSKNLQERDVLPEVRMQRSALAEPAKKRGKKIGKEETKVWKERPKVCQEEPEKVCKEARKEVQKERRSGVCKEEET